MTPVTCLFFPWYLLIDTRLPLGSFLTKSFSWKYVKYYDTEKYCSRSKKSFFKEKLLFFIK